MRCVPFRPPRVIGMRGSRFGIRADQDDMQANDHPQPNLPLQFSRDTMRVIDQLPPPIGTLIRAASGGVRLVFNILRQASDETLRDILHFTFRNIHQTGQTGIDLIDRFYRGSGGEQYHGPTSHLAGLARDTNTFRNNLTQITDNITNQLLQQGSRTNVLDPNSITLFQVPMLFSTATTDLSVPLSFRAMVGGIQGVRVTLLNFNFFPAMNSYFAQIKIELLDAFGVGNADLYSPDLMAMWILQHEREGHAPFVNRIVLVEEIQGQL